MSEQATKIRKLRQQARRDANRKTITTTIHDDMTEKSFGNVSMVTTDETDSEGVAEITRTSKYAVSRLAAVPTVLRDHVTVSRESGVHVNCQVAALPQSRDGYAMVALGPTAHVWRYTSPNAAPETHTCSLPSQEGTAIGHLTPVAPGFSEPGLVLLDRDSGDCIFWEAVGGAMTDGLLHKRRSVETQIKLYSETIDHVNLVDPTTLLLSLSSGRLCGLSLRDTNGSVKLSSWTLRDTGRGLLGNLRSAFTVSSSKRGICGVTTVKTDNGLTIFVATKRGHLAVWQTQTGGEAHLTLDTDLLPLLIADVDALYPQASSTLSVHDIEYVASDNYLVVLTSIKVGASCMFLLYTLDLETQTVVSRHRIQSYVAPVDSSESPRLARPAPGDTLYVVFTHAVVLIDTVTKQNQNFIAFGKWEDSILLKSDVSILGFGEENKTRSRHSAIVAVTENSGVLRITRFEEDDDKEATRNVHTLESGICKSRIEQGVFYGHFEHTPLEFVASGEYDVKFSDETVQAALLQVAREVCTTTSPYLGGVLPSMTFNLGLRCARLETLCEYGYANFSEQLDTSTKLSLVWMAEKVAACAAIWDMCDSFDGGYQLLEHVIGGIEGSQIDDSHDQTRDFFISRPLEAEKLIVGLYEAAQGGYNLSHVTAAVLKAIVAASEMHRRLYRVLELPNDVTCMVLPWTCDGHMMTTWSGLFELLKGKQDMAVAQASLASALCEQSCQAINWHKKNNRNFADLENTYFQKRSQWVKAVVDSGERTAAVAICEQYELYRPLVEILDSELQGALKRDDEPEANAIRDKVELYLHAFGFPFATQLYLHYIELRNFRSLFTEFQAHQGLLKKFFSSGNYAYISWIQSLGLGEYSEAAQALMTATNESKETFPGPQLRNRQNQLSVAKLALLEAGQDTEELDKELEMCQIQSSLTDHVMQHVSGDDIFTDKILPSLPSVLMTQAKKSLSKLVAQKCLGVFELVDLCSYVGFSYDALEAVVYSNTSKRGVLSTTVWVRCLLQTDWSVALAKQGKTDAEVAQQLVSTPLYETLVSCFSSGLIGKQDSPLVVPEFSKLQRPSHATLAVADRYKTSDVGELEKELIGEFDEALAILEKKDNLKWIQGLVDQARIEVNES